MNKIIIPGMKEYKKLKNMLFEAEELLKSPKENSGLLLKIKKELDASPKTKKLIVAEFGQMYAALENIVSVNPEFDFHLDVNYANMGIKKTQLDWISYFKKFGDGSYMPSMGDLYFSFKQIYDLSRSDNEDLKNFAFNNKLKLQSLLSNVILTSTRGTYNKNTNKGEIIHHIFDDDRLKVYTYPRSKEDGLLFINDNKLKKDSYVQDLFTTTDSIDEITNCLSYVSDLTPKNIRIQRKVRESSIEYPCFGIVIKDYNLEINRWKTPGHSLSMRG